MLKVNLQYFAEDDDFDLDSFAESFESDWKDDEPEEEEVVDETPEEADEEPPIEDQPSDDEEPQSEPQDEPTVPPSNDTPQDNGRWKEMRKQAEEGRKYQEFINGLANQFGMTPEEYMTQVAQAQLQQQSEEQGVPVEILQRLNEQEAQLSELKNKDVLGNFQSGIDKVIGQYSLKNDDPSIQETFKWMAQNGHIDEQQLPKMAFEDAYFLANRSTIIQKEIEAATQKSLANKKKRQEVAAVATDGASTSQPITDEDITEDVHAFLKDAGFI